MSKKVKINPVLEIGNLINNQENSLTAGFSNLKNELVSIVSKIKSGLILFHGPDDMARALSMLTHIGLTKDNGLVLLNEQGDKKIKLKHPDLFSNEVIWQHLPNQVVLNNYYCLSELFAGIRKVEAQNVFLDIVTKFKGNERGYRDYTELDGVLSQDKGRVLTWCISDYRYRHAQQPLQSIESRSVYQIYTAYDDKKDELEVWGRGQGKMKLLFTLSFYGPNAGQVIPYVPQIFHPITQKEGYFSVGDVIKSKNEDGITLVKIDCIRRYKPSGISKKVGQVNKDDVRNPRADFDVELVNLTNGHKQSMSLIHLL